MTLFSKKSLFPKLFFGLLSFFLLWESGCSTTQRIYSSIVPDKSGLKKKALVLPILDQAGLSEARVENIRSILISALTKEGTLVVPAKPNPDAPVDKRKLPRYGIIIDPDQAKRAEEMGMNVLVTAVISPLDFSSRKTGIIWPFRRVKHEAEISMVVNAFDVVTGTLFLSHLESRKIKAEVDLLEVEQEGQTAKPEVDENTVDKALSQIVASQASAVSNALRVQPWSGMIMSVGPEKLTISAGQDVGLVMGRLFEVFGQGEPIRSADGSLITPLGLKLGEIKVVEVMETQALAIPLGIAPYAPRQIIRLKN